MAILQIIQDSIALKVQAVIDLKADALGIQWAKERGIDNEIGLASFYK